MQVEYQVMFPIMDNQITDKEVTFSINNMKCKGVGVVYHILHAYNPTGDEILIKNKPVHIGKRWVVTNTWNAFYDTYNLSDDIQNHAGSFQIELRLVGIDDENPLQFTECMFKTGEFGDYHETNGTIRNARINFINNSYVNLYSADRDGAYLQIIRPNRDYFSMYTLRNSKCSVLVPHLSGEVEEDSPLNIFCEYMYQNEQMTNIYHTGFKM